MNCPVCTVPLTMSDRQGIEIDYCPQCRGVWLDRGELDKLIERSRQPEPQYAEAARPRVHADRFHVEHDDRHRRRKNWLEDLFD